MKELALVPSEVICKLNLDLYDLVTGLGSRSSANWGSRRGNSSSYGHILQGAFLMLLIVAIQRRWNLQPNLGLYLPSHHIARHLMNTNMYDKTVPGEDPLLPDYLSPL